MYMCSIHIISTLAGGGRQSKYESYVCIRMHYALATACYSSPKIE